MRIASVEDDPIQTNLIKQTLTQAGHEVRHFSTGRECLAALAKSEKFDLFLLDWELPDVTGVDILVWVRNHLGTQIPVLFLTNRTEDADLLQAFQLGADDYIHKPFSPAILVARINANLRRNTSMTHIPSELVVGAYRFDHQNKNA